MVAALVVACDDTDPVDGTRGSCAWGGSALACVDGEETPEAACWKLVECAAIPLDAPDNNFDWGRCVDYLSGLPDERGRFAIACVAASACDELRGPGSPTDYYGGIYCLEFGDR